MPITTTVLVEPKLAEIIATSQYTSTGATTVIDKFTVTNVGSVPATLTVYLIEAAGTEGAFNTIMDARNVEVGECYTCPELVGHVLLDAEIIATMASVASTLTIRASGRVIT